MSRILVVDDEIYLHRIYEEFLSLKGDLVIGFATNGEEAINTYKSLVEKPDIILMDYRMPIKNGIDASKEILQVNNPPKIIFISADDSIKQEALSIGVKGFIDKPFSLEIFIEMIRKTEMSL